MRIFCRILRVIGVLVGLLLAAAGLTGLFGSMGGFGEVPLSPGERLLSGLPLLIFGILLLLPQSRFLRGKRHLFLSFGYVALILAALPFTVLGVIAYYEGGRHWLIIPTSLVLLAVLISNALVLWYLGRQSPTPPDKSFKTNPSRSSG